MRRIAACLSARSRAQLALENTGAAVAAAREAGDTRATIGSARPADAKALSQLSMTY